MGQQTILVIVGVTVGVAIGLLVACCVLIGIKFRRKRQSSSNVKSISVLPIRANGIAASMESSASISTSEILHGSPQTAKKNYNRSWWGHNGQSDLFASASGIPRYSYKDIQKATQNFTTILGQGSFGPVYKALMPTGETVAVKVLASDSKQGEKEFQTEVLLLARLHHRNLVNLVGYCVDKGQHMLIYQFMSNGSLGDLLYGESLWPLSWEQRIQIAHDISHGIEYLHEGATPPVIHRDLKSANILLDQSMTAKVADFGLSREEVFDGRKSGLKGTYGYMDPDYVSTNRFTTKSDIYSFGIILFELITAINPQQGLLEYVNLAQMSADGKSGWDEILDERLVGKCNMEEVRLLAKIAQRCIHQVPRKRPSIGDISLAIARIRKKHLNREDSSISLIGEIPHVIKRIENQQVELSTLVGTMEKSDNAS